MTAIFGVCRWNDLGDPVRDLDRIGKALSRLGRRPQEIWSDDLAAVGRRLYPILSNDESDLGPGKYGAGRYSVCADVQLSDPSMLCELLGVNRSEQISDLELVALAIEEWGDAAFQKIYGSFAIAAWDTRDKRMLLARDICGRRPLFYNLNANRLAFASLPKGLKALPDVAPEADPAEIERFMRLLPPSHGKSHHRDILRVMPGHVVTIRGDGQFSKRYWEPLLEPLKFHQQIDYEKELGVKLRQSVDAALRDVPTIIGAQLSAGFDSTAVVTTAAQILARDDKRIIAYTAVPSEDYVDHLEAWQIADEGALAAKTAALYSNIEHIRLPTDRHPLETLNQIGLDEGMPSLNLCNETWANAIYGAARQRGLSVMLEGSMGNATISESGVLALPELFWKGRIARWFKIGRGLVRNGWMRWRGVLWNTLKPKVPSNLWFFLERSTGRLNLPIRRYVAMQEKSWERASRSGKEEAATGNGAEKLNVLDSEQVVWSSVDERLSMLNEDFGAYYKEVLAEYGLDIRDPTADRRLIEFSLRIPVERLIEGGNPRAILRKVLEDRAPSEVLDNRRKGYQGADWWMHMQGHRDEYAAEIERIAMFDPTNEMIDVDRLRKLIEDWPEEGSDYWKTHEAEVDYRYSMLRAISAASFMRRASGSNY